MASDLTAPYKRFRPTFFYEDFPNGTYAADVAGCHWTCENCWSGYGWKGVESSLKRYEPKEVVDKIIEGMKRNAQTACRLSGGEPFMYWEHTFEVIRDFCERTRGLVMDIDGVTDEHGAPLAIMVETNGSLLDDDKLRALDSLDMDDSYRVILQFGMKSTHPEGLAELTGMNLETATRFHEQQLANFAFAVVGCEKIGVMANYLDEFTDIELFANLQRRIEKYMPGGGRNMGIATYKKYPGRKQMYVPKRFRYGLFPDHIDGDDPEVLQMLQNADGSWMTADEMEANADDGPEMDFAEYVATSRDEPFLADDWAGDEYLGNMVKFASQMALAEHGQLQ